MFRSHFVAWHGQVAQQVTGVDNGAASALKGALGRHTAIAQLTRTRGSEYTKGISRPQGEGTVGRRRAPMGVPARQDSAASLSHLAHVGHELRTPLSTVMTLSQLMLDGSTGALNAEQVKYMEVIRRNGTTVLRLISDLIDMSRLETRRLPLMPVSFDVRDAIARVVSEMRAESEGKGVALVVESAGSLPPVVADPDRVGQVLTNLVGNAVKFTDAGQITVETELFDSAVAVHVTDTGIGIPAAAHSSLFRDFYQVNAAEARRRGGSGLGLAISKGLVTLMGGDIWLTSRLGEGSRFSFTLPRERREHLGTLRRPKRPPATG